MTTSVKISWMGGVLAATVVARAALGASPLPAPPSPPIAAIGQLPDGPGKDTVTRVCGVCHAPDRAASVRLTAEGWSDLVAEMVRRGAKATDAEVTEITTYLSTNFLGDAPKPLNINSASAIDLESVAGLLRKEAAALREYLAKNGPCKALADLKNVPGVDYKKLEARKDYLVCFEVVPAPPKGGGGDR